MLKMTGVIIGVLATHLSSAQIFKCEIDGGITYQQNPCPGVGEELVVNTGPPQPDAGLRDSEIEFLKAVERERALVRAARQRERERQEALKIEKEKVRAQQETARAIRQLQDPFYTHRRGWTR